MIGALHVVSLLSFIFYFIFIIDHIKVVIKKYIEAFLKYITSKNLLVIKSNLTLQSNQ